MNQSFIELPPISELSELGEKFEKHVAPRSLQANAPLAYVFGSQCINYGLAYFVATSLLLFGLLNLPAFQLSQLPHASGLFWFGVGLLVCFSFFVSRVLVSFYLGCSLGEHLMGIQVVGEGALKYNAILWETLHFICPALWLMEMLMRLAGLRFGVPYTFRYKAAA